MITINQPSGGTSIKVSCSHHPYWHGALNSSAHNYAGTATGHAVAARDARVHRDNMHGGSASIVDETQWAGIPDALQLPDQAEDTRHQRPTPESVIELIRGGLGIKLWDWQARMIVAMVEEVSE